MNSLILTKRTLRLAPIVASTLGDIFAILGEELSKAHIQPLWAARGYSYVEETLLLAKCFDRGQKVEELVAAMQGNWQVARIPKNGMNERQIIISAKRLNKEIKHPFALVLKAIIGLAQDGFFSTLKKEKYEVMLFPLVEVDEIGMPLIAIVEITCQTVSIRLDLIDGNEILVWEDVCTTALS